MWHPESVKLFLEDQNTNPRKIRAMEQRAAQKANKEGLLSALDLDEVIGSPELARKFEQASEKNFARYQASNFMGKVNS